MHPRNALLATFNAIGAGSKKYRYGKQLEKLQQEDIQKFKGAATQGKQDDAKARLGRVER